MATALLTLSSSMVILMLTVCLTVDSKKVGSLAGVSVFIGVTVLPGAMLVCASKKLQG